MTNQEFSDSFDTLLNSYASQSQFGEEANKNEIVLDEYEKSVLLTQAQDIVIKTFFDRKQNSAGEGFDDSTRRQVDFSSLIKAATLQPEEFDDGESPAFDDRGIIYKMPLRKYPVEIPATDGEHWTQAEIDAATAAYTEDDVEDMSQEEKEAWMAEHPAYGKTTDDWKVAPVPAHTEWDTKEGTTDVLFILNEQLKTKIGDGDSAVIKNYVIVPINYKEYDREMTKAYAQPLKKQAWRLFQNSTQGFDIQSELIPRWNLTDKETITGYKIRYIRRPCPIVLVDLPNELEIDGFTKAQECELNPILHPEILQKALEIAIATRGGVNRVNNPNNKESVQ